MCACFVCVYVVSVRMRCVCCQTFVYVLHLCVCGLLYVVLTKTCANGVRMFAYVCSRACVCVFICCSMCGTRFVNAVLCFACVRMLFVF